MEKKLQPDAEKLFIELFTLVGESLVDNQIENRKDFVKAQNKIVKLLSKYKINRFEDLR